MKRAIEIEFGPSLFESPRELLFKLQQQRSVTEYYKEFVSLANRTNIEPPEALRDCFINNLQSKIKREVKAQCPPSLMRAVSLARLYEDKCVPTTKITHGPQISQPQNQQQNNWAVTQTLPKTNLPPLLPIPNQRPNFKTNRAPIKKLTMVEQQIRRENGFCFWCDEKFTPHHKCPNKHFMLYQLEATDEVDFAWDEEIKTEEATKEDVLQQLEQQVKEHHLSYNALHRTTGPATIRVKAQINGMEIQALINEGSSDSFIQPRIAKFFNLTVAPAPRFKVMVGNFETMTVEGYIPSLEVSLQGYKLQIPEAYVLHVAGGDLILGTTWLKQLKTHIVDYDSSFIRFMHEGEFITIFWGQFYNPHQAQFHHIKRLVNTDAIAAAFTLEIHQ